MNDLFFTGDTHFRHKNILKYCPTTRPYPSIEEHDEALIERWNSVVSPSDLVYHLGDVAFAPPEVSEKILQRLNGRIHLILGNHDRKLPRGRFVEVSTYADITVNRTHFVLFHFPIESWDRVHHGAIHLHGHTHGAIGSHHGIELRERRMDVGVDTHPRNEPWALEDILEAVK